MAAFVRTSFVNNYLNRPKDDPSRISLAVWPTGGLSGEGLKAQGALLRRPDFIITGTTDSNTAVLNAGAAQSYLVNLSDEGVAFPANFDRDIIIECWTRDETGPNYQKIQQTVRGSATAPAATGGVTNLSPKVGGLVTFSSGTATAAAAYNGFSITGAATATGRYAAAIPKARRVINTSGTIQVVGTGTLSGAGVVSLNAITLATGVIEIGIRGGDDGANVAPADTEQMVIEFDVLPIESCELGFDTTTTPDEVLVGALGQASENVEWLVHVYVGELRSNVAATASE